ncbi:MAG TPA: hypothetical protein VMS98_06505 [Thermoanaerobaculia bacterium]|nr:hypothetical protein [Thermoanaerobaculia bacterium]
MRNQRLEQFIAEKIHSIEEVEILALLFRSPDTYWTATAMAQHLGLKEETVAAKVRDLERRGLAESGQTSGSFRFGTESEELKRDVAMLVEAYRDQRVTVINTVYSANLTRLRSFADAFKLGGKDS